MIDTNLLKSDPKKIAKQLISRNYQLDIQQYESLEKKRKKHQTETEELQARRNLLSKEYGKDEINVETSSGNLHSQILKENLVETNIGIPSIEWDKIPLIKEMNTKNLNITNDK